MINLCHWAYFLFDSRTRTMENMRNALMAKHEKALRLSAELNLLEAQIAREEKEFTEWCLSDWTQEEIDQAKLEANQENAIEFFQTDTTVNGHFESGLKLTLKADTNAPMLFLEWLALLESEGKRVAPVRFKTTRGEDSKGNSVLRIRFMMITKDRFNNCGQYIKDNL